MKVADEDALAATLSKAGIEDFAACRYSVVEESNATPDQNKLVRRRTNELLIHLAAEGPIRDCIHITGEMRALSDPLHRKACRVLFERHKVSFATLYRIPKEKRATPVDVAAWNVSRWRGSSWLQHLAAFDAIAEGHVNVHASEEMASIQFTVFANRYILLQEQHEDFQRAKRIWLLDSPGINERLTEIAYRCLGGAARMEPQIYGGFAMSLSHVGSFQLLDLLKQKGQVTVAEALDHPSLSSVKPLLPQFIQHLLAMRFIDHSVQDGYQITDVGSDYLAFMSEQ